MNIQRPLKDNEMEDDLEFEEEFYSYAQSVILSCALHTAEDKFLRKGYEINCDISKATFTDGIMNTFDNDTEIFYTALMSGHSYAHKINTPDNLIEMGEKLFSLCKSDFKKIVRRLETKI